MPYISVKIILKDHVSISIFRRPAIKVNDKSALFQAIKDGAHIRATVEDSSRHVEVVDITGGDISGNFKNAVQNKITANGLDHTFC